jgi:hypothetical protein
MRLGSWLELGGATMLPASPDNSGECPISPAGRSIDSQTGHPEAACKSSRGPRQLNDRLRANRREAGDPPASAFS